MPEKNSPLIISPDNLNFDFFWPFLEGIQDNGHRGIVIRGRGYEVDVHSLFERMKPELFRRIRLIPGILVHPFLNRREYSSSRGKIVDYSSQLEIYEIEHSKARFLVYDPLSKFGDISDRYFGFEINPERGEKGDDLYEHFRAHHF